jgi:hypothetical protein
MNSPESSNPTTHYELSGVHESTNTKAISEYKPTDIEPIKQRIEEVKEICVDNIEKVLQRGEKIELLVDQSGKLQSTSHDFQRSARKLRNTMVYRRIRWYCCLVLLFALSVYIFSWIVCGNPSIRHCR